MTDLLAIDEDADKDAPSPPKSILYDYQDLLEFQAKDGSRKTQDHLVPNPGTVRGPKSLSPATLYSAPPSGIATRTARDVYYPASLDGLKRQLAAMQERNLALEQEIVRLNNEIVSIRERAKKLGAALFESAL